MIILIFLQSENLILWIEQLSHAKKFTKSSIMLIKTIIRFIISTVYQFLLIKRF